MKDEDREDRDRRKREGQIENEKKRWIKRGRRAWGGERRGSWIRK